MTYLYLLKLHRTPPSHRKIPVKIGTPLKVDNRIVSPQLHEFPRINLPDFAFVVQSAAHCPKSCSSVYQGPQAFPGMPRREPSR